MSNVNNKRWRVKVIDAQGNERSQWTGYAPNKMFARANASADGHRLRIGDRYTVSIAPKD
jgi:hypothetical protein